MPPQVRITSPRVGFLYNNGIQERVISEFKTIVINDIRIFAEVDYATVPLERAESYYDGKESINGVGIPKVVESFK